MSSPPARSDGGRLDGLGRLDRGFRDRRGRGVGGRGAARAELLEQRADVASVVGGLGVGCGCGLRTSLVGVRRSRPSARSRPCRSSARRSRWAARRRGARRPVARSADSGGDGGVGPGRRHRRLVRDRARRLHQRALHHLVDLDELAAVGAQLTDLALEIGTRRSVMSARTRSRSARASPRISRARARAASSASRVFDSTAACVEFRSSRADSCASRTTRRACSSALLRRSAAASRACVEHARGLRAERGDEVLVGRRLRRLLRAAPRGRARGRRARARDSASW